MARRLPSLTKSYSAAGLIGLAGIVWYVATEAIESNPIVVADTFNAYVQPAAGAVAAKSAALADFKETLERPLFTSDRRPLARSAPPRQEASAAAITADSAPANIRLLGIMVSAEGGPRALIEAGGERSSSWAAIGTEIGSWRLTSIDKDRVVVERGGARSVLTLYPSAAIARAE